MDNIWNIVTGALGSEAFVGAVVTLATALITAMLKRGISTFEAATGIQVEEKHQRALHEAVTTSVESALRHGPDTGARNLMAHVKAHLHESVPDALSALAPSDSVLERLIDRKATEYMGKFLPREGQAG